MRYANRVVVLYAVVATGLSMMPIAASQQPTGEPFSTEIRKIKDGLFVIPGYDGAVTGGNVAVRVTKEGTIIVDDRLPPSSAEIADKVKSVTPQPIRYVLSTHGHGDHTGGHPEFITVAEIIAHRNNRANMIRSKLVAPPRVVFSDQAAVFLGGVEVQAIHFGRGHTNGDAVIYFPDLRVIHTGDLITEGMPVLDYNNGASAVEWVTVLDKILELDFDTVIPGHGPLMTKEQVRTDRQKLMTMNQRMAEQARKGVPLEQVFDGLKLADLGWNQTVSTVAFRGGLKGYYEEMKSQPATK
jgi:glyoxylase-like metal-dependent hydrolase (beta-lactamase superfamily II)